MSEAILSKLEQHDVEFKKVHSNIADLKADVSGLKADVSDIKADVSGLKADVTGLKADVSKLDTAFHRMELLMEDNQKTQQLILENVVSLHRQIMPREGIEARFQTNENRISALEYSVSAPK